MTKYQCSAHKGDYLNYDCYMRLINYFDTIKPSDTDTTYINNYIESLKNDGSIVRKYNVLFKDLLQHLKGDSVIIQLSYHFCCPYINYWLNFKIEDKYKDLQENNLENFKHFAEYYAKNRFGTFFDKNTCASYLTPIFNEEKYKIMKILYKMYYLFNQITRYNVQYQEKEICNNYGLVNKFYRDLKQIYNTNTDLMEKLNYFGNVIKSSERSYDALCGNNLLILISPPPVSKPAQETTVISGESSSTYVASNLQNPKVSEPHVEGTDSDKQQDLLKTSEVAESPEDVAPKTELEKDNLAAVSLPELSEETHHRDYTFGRPNVRPDLERRTSTYGEFIKEGDFTSIPGQLSQNASEAKGFSTITDTITGFISEVQPAPILGVSGGMGALFLLFKYTPVGSFFGGRRRRIRQIPSSFGGFTPGEFPIFHEYEGGNIGYGPMNPLAE